jgi:hypothetical protein
MEDNRRDFLKKALLGSIAVSAAGGLSAISTACKASNMVANSKDETDLRNNGITFPEWEISFDETKSELKLINGQVSMTGQLNFVSESGKWTAGKSRDGITNRNVLVDSRNNVQGYFTFHQNCGQLQLSFNHRTAQAFHGTLTFKGNINFFDGSFACKTRARAGERVLSMKCGPADSLLNDSLFAPETDVILQLDAVYLQIETLGSGSYTFAISGRISESSEAIFKVNIGTNYFRNRYVPYYKAIDRNRCPRTPTGWMSWNTYFDTATAGDNLAEARVGQKYLQPFGCEFWSIESWQGNSDQLPVRDFYNMNLEVNEKQFPEGMKQLAEDIRKLGFRPGLWTAPFGTGNKEFYESCKDWFLHNREGEPVSSWNGRYTLDPTVPKALEHLKNIHRIASREWGYEFFKIDGMSGRDEGYCAHLYERPEIRTSFRDPSCPNPFELCIKSLREGIGEDRVFLACQGHSTGPEALYADASRIGADIVDIKKPIQWHNVLNQGRCTINQLFTHNIVMMNDPDTLLVRDLTLEEARVTTTIVALPGQVTFFGDKLAGLPVDRMRMLQQTLPVAEVLPMSLYPCFSMLSVWNLHVRNTVIGDYNVVALFNWTDEPDMISFTTEELGIDSDLQYILYEFWTNEYFGFLKDSFGMDVPAHGVRLLAVHTEKAVPQWISSDRHVAQNAMEISELEWNTGNRTLEGKIRLIGTFPLTMRLKIPKDYSYESVECIGAKCSAKHEGDPVLAVTFISDKTGEFEFKIKC